MRFPRGHPSWQKGTPQSMQRAPWRRRASVAHGSMTWRQSWRRSATGRYGCLPRLNSTKPVTFPTALPVRPFHDRALPRDSLRLGPLHGVEGTLVVARHDLDEAPLSRVPLLEEALGHARPRVTDVLAEERADRLDILRAD